jgi:hypothetical protein
VEESILTSTKQLLDQEEDYTAFDLNVLTQINTAFSVLVQVGIQELANFYVVDKTMLWTDLNVDPEILNMIKTYVFLKVKSYFDPPTTSFHITSVKEQLHDLEWRINVAREEALSDIDPVV